jgi:hypothetical protein
VDTLPIEHRPDESCAFLSWLVTYYCHAWPAYTFTFAKAIIFRLLYFIGFAIKSMPQHVPTIVSAALLPLLAGLLTVPLTVRAQAPAWTMALTASGPQAGGDSFTQATAVDANGNVFVTGFFSGTLTFGTTVLTSAGQEDIFVAKYVPSTGTWAWAQRGGGTGSDFGSGIAVVGSSIYVVGMTTNNTANANAVNFGNGTTQVGVSSFVSEDIVLAKYTDNGPSATLNWTQVGGGAGADFGNGVATSGNNVYVVGSLTNNRQNGNAVLFGGGGTSAGTLQQFGTSATNSIDLVVAKYVDMGTTATAVWTQVGGGSDADAATGVAASGNSVYVTGFVTNNRANSRSVVFGGASTTAGTIPQYGASTVASRDLVVAKYTDSGASALLSWTQVGGGTDFDQGTGVAINGTSVYVTGFIYNDAANNRNVVFGGTGTLPGTTIQAGATGTNGTGSQDIVVAKYLDNGASATLGWTQVGGGTGLDTGYAIAVRGSAIYVTGSLYNSAANAASVIFGGTGTTLGTVAVNGASAAVSYDVLVARYLDQGTSATVAWTQTGGGLDTDEGYGLAISPTGLYIVGSATPAAFFGSTAISSPAGYRLNLLASFGATALPVRSTAHDTGPTLFPNPTTGSARLVGVAPGATVQLVDAMGRRVATATADAAGMAQLVAPANAAPGVYLVRTNEWTTRLLLE